MESSVVFSHTCPPVDIDDYTNLAIPVEAPIFSSDSDNHSLPGPTTS